VLLHVSILITILRICAYKRRGFQAVSLDWKWLFIYPDQKIATINTQQSLAFQSQDFLRNRAKSRGLFALLEFRNHRDGDARRR